MNSRPTAEILLATGIALLRDGQIELLATPALAFLASFDERWRPA